MGNIFCYHNILASDSGLLRKDQARGFGLYITHGISNNDDDSGFKNAYGFYFCLFLFLKKINKQVGCYKAKHMCSLAKNAILLTIKCHVSPGPKSISIFSERKTQIVPELLAEIPGV